MLQLLSADVELEIGLSFGFDRVESDSPRPALATPSPPDSHEGFSATLPTQDEVERLFASWTLEESSSSDKWDSSTLDSSTNPSLDGHDPPVDYDPKDSTPADPLSFLASVFPKLSRTTLASRLDQNAGDLETMVEILLNEDFIASAEEQSTFVGESDFDYDDYGLENGIVPLAKLDHLSTGGGARKAQRKKEKSYAKASQVLNLTDVLHRSASPVPSATATPATTFSPLDSNRWVTLDSTAGYLATLLHLPPGRVTSAYHRFDSSLPLAIESLLDTLETERPFDELPDHERLLAELSIVLPDSSTAGLRRLLCATEGDSSDAMDLKLKLEEIFREDGSALMNGLLGFGAGGDSRRVVVVHEGSTLESALKTKRVVPSKQGWTKITSPKEPLSSNSSSNRSSSNTSSRYASTSTASSSLNPTAGLSSTDCAYHANDYLTKRNDAFRSAARAFQAGGTQRGVAWYYAEAGRELDRKKRAWEQRAAFAVVGERRSVCRTALVDR